MAYLAFTYFVPIRQQPHWLTQARTLPLIQIHRRGAAVRWCPIRTMRDFATRARRHHDELGDLIRRRTRTPTRLPEDHVHTKACRPSTAKKAMAPRTAAR